MPIVSRGVTYGLIGHFGLWKIIDEECNELVMIHQAPCIDTHLSHVLRSVIGQFLSAPDH